MPALCVLLGALFSILPPPPPPQVSGYSTNNSYIRSPPETTRVTAAQIRQSVDASLARLGTDHIDLLQIHWCAHCAGLAEHM